QAQTEGATPLQQKLARFSKQVGIIVGIISLGIFALGRWQGKPIYDMFFIVVSLAVSSIPEGLIAVVTITLALSTQKLFKRKALVRKIKSIESLGTTTVICTDKTGTLTQNHMTVTDVFIGGSAFGRNGQAVVPIDIHPDHFNTLCEIITYCNNAALPNVGDPTEIALLEMTKHMQLPTKARIGEIPFDSDTKYMVTQYTEVDFMKGSVEHVLKLCDTVLRNNEIIGLNEDIQKKILEQNDSYARSAIRVLGCAYKDKQSEHYTFVGMVGMIDPPREEVPQAIQECYDAGIRVIMITGDHLLTAQAIASQIGLVGQAMEGAAFEAATNKSEILQNTNIFARVTPAQKVMICEGLKQLGHHVVMTGDGVNDAAALKAADIGFAMGITGTEVTKDASDIVLLDDNFATIVNTIREGRVVYANIKKFIKFMLAVNFDEMIRVVFNFFVGLPVPMTAIQILWINLVTDSLPTLALGFDEGDSDIMKQKPRDPKESLLHGSRVYIIGASVIAATIGICLFIYKYNTEGLEVARTMSVVSAVCFEMFLIFSVRDVNKPLRSIKPNRYLIGSVILVLTLQFTIIYSTRGRHFDFVPLSTQDILICVGAGLVGTLFFELKKLLLRKRS
ncbi:MAG: cation-translocating P-type ATPase, partial [Candidatus Absconditabacterales bacterium]